jgi:3-oxoacyl-[acyl-carrier protein] reductase
VSTLPDRTAIVTGASAGIGLAITTALCGDGFAVTMAARREPRLNAAAAALSARGFDVAPVVADVSDPDVPGRLVTEHIERFGRLDLVAANAGWGTNGTVTDSAARDIDRMLRVNVSSVFALAAVAIPAMRRSGDALPAWFVITSSMSGAWPTAGFAGYSAAKAAAISLARSIAAEEATTGVRSCAICPGFVATDMTAWLGDSVPTETMIEANDIAETVRFLTRLSPAVSVTDIVLRRAGATGQHAP